MDLIGDALLMNESFNPGRMQTLDLLILRLESQLFIISLIFSPYFELTISLFFMASYGEGASVINDSAKFSAKGNI